MTTNTSSSPHVPCTLRQQWCSRVEHLGEMERPHCWSGTPVHQWVVCAMWSVWFHEGVCGRISLLLEVPWVSCASSRSRRRPLWTEWGLVRPRPSRIYAPYRRAGQHRSSRRSGELRWYYKGHVAMGKYFHIEIISPTHHGTLLVLLVAS